MTTDLNVRIAKAKGWTWVEDLRKAFWFGYLGRPMPKFMPLTHWRNPKGKPAICPDYVGTLEGMAGLLRDLLDEPDGPFALVAQMTNWMCANQDWSRCWASPLDRPGDCVAEAWMSVFGKEAVDGQATI